MGFTSNIFLFACIFTGHCSSSFQACVPKSQSRHTVLDLSQKNISELHFSDFSSLPELQVLNLSHNLLRDLDFSVFKFSKKLVCLDLSHNNLWNIFCQTLAGLRHLDLSFNKFKTLPICQEFGSMLNLEYLGLSATMIQKSDFKDITHLQLRTVVITLEDLFHYESKSLTVLNTKNLQIVYPTNQNFIFPLLYDGMSTSEELELSNIQYNSTDFPLPSFDTLQKFKTINMRFNNVDLSWSTILRISVIVWCTPVEYFTVKNLTFWGSIQTHIDFSFLLSDWAQFVNLGSSMKALTLKHIRTKIFSFSQEILYRTFSELSIENLTISDAYMPHMLCPSKTSLFQYLDFSHNALTDELFKNCDTLTHLKMFILRRNQLENLSKVSSMTSKMKSLKHLDISSNLLYYDDNNDDEDENHCNWVGTLAKLNLSSNKLTDSVFGCLPINVQILDLQNNQIRTIPKDVAELKALKELNIAFNGLTELPGCSHFRGLELLNIEENSILTPSSDFFHSCQNIRELRGGHNPFQCSCELRDFINFEKKSGRRLIGWPESYVCEYPDGLKGTQLKDFHLSELSCNTTLLLIIAIVVTVLVVAVTSFLCIYFDIMWYLKMMWQWAQTKHRIRNSNPEDLQNVLQFHAFISYSERDSLWVQSHLIPNLEKEDGSVQICLHERNFVPGKSIVENIINCIEKSHKSIFVLSPNFVQSEWCHYELYFAHHKLFSESSNSLILILLEPIPQYLIPARYHKLKALMAKRTYLEWPKEKSKHGLFWSNLKAAININLPVSREMVVV